MDNLKNRNRFGLGLVLISIGLVFFAGNFGLIPQSIYSVLTSWPMILVAIGLLNLFNGKYTPALILFAVAAYFLIPSIVPGVDMHDFRKFWPLLLIVIGIIVIMRRNKPNRSWEPSVTTNSQDYIDDVAILGGSVTQVETPNFKGGKITAIFGGSEIHLTRSQLSPEGASLEMVTIFGGSKLIVPRDWNVRVEMVNILGGFADKRMYVNNDNPQRNVLVIKGVAIFGGGELSNI